MEILYLALATFSRSGQQVAQKEYAKRSKNSSFLYSLIAVLVAIIFYFLLPIFTGTGLYFNLNILVYSLLFALTFIVSMVTGFLAIRTGSLSLSSLINQYSLIVPALYGIFFLAEPTQTTLFIGIGLFVLSLLLINLKTGQKGTKITLVWIIYAALSFISNGACATIINVQQRDFNGMFKSEFMIIGLAVSALVLIALSLSFERKDIIYNVKKAGVFGAIGGAFNGLNNFMIMLLAVMLPASVAYPVMSASATVLTTLIAFIFYKEKMSIVQLVGIALGIGAIVMLNL